MSQTNANYNNATSSQSIPSYSIDGVDPKSIAEKTKQDIVTLLFSQSMRVAISHPVASLIVVIWFSAVAPLTELLLWLGCITIFSAGRLLVNKAYQSYHNEQNTHLWIYAWVSLSTLLGATYSFGFIYFTPIDQAVYIASVGMFITALSSASVIGLGASKFAMLSFYLPTTLPSAVYFGLYGGDTGLMLAFALCIFSLVIVSLLRTMTSAFKKSIVLNYQYQQEIEKRKLIEQQLQDISRRDGLTGLFNRRYFDERLNAEIGRAHRNHTPLCLVMFDIDCFKEYNDAYGHVGGDNCLIEVANIVEKLTSRQGDLIARYGGEEFAIILPNIDLTGAIAFANKLQQTVQNKRIPHVASRLTTLKCVTISVGVTNLTPFMRLSSNQLIETADRALYQAKAEGRNRVNHIENNGISQAFK